MFTQPCFIRKDTPELRKKLKDLGQRENEFDDFSGKWLAANHGMFISVSEGFQNLCKEDIDCGTNERLFLAIAAIRNDTDIYQWFVNNNGEFFKCYENEFSHFRFDTNDILNIANAIEKGSLPCLSKPLVPYEDTKNWHKATVEELIEHFKYK